MPAYSAEDLREAMKLMQEHADEPEVAVALLEQRAESAERQALGYRQLADGMRALGGIRPSTANRRPGAEIGKTFGAPERPAGMEAVRQ